MSLLLGEPEADAITSVLEGASDVRISAATLAEARIVADRRGFASELDDLVNGLAFGVDPVIGETARLVSGAFAIWGKGIHPAGLNFGDCFSYVSARHLGAPLLFIGDDFSKTDIESALA